MSVNIVGYQVIKVISQGAFGYLYLISNIEASKKYLANGIQKKYYSDPKMKKYIDNEISILKDVNHPNIIKLIDVKETLKHIYIITEYCNGGNLKEYLNKYKKLSEEIVQYIMKQVIEAMKYLHNKKIMHRNLKLNNILINYDDENDRKNKNVMKGKKNNRFSICKILKKRRISKNCFGNSTLYVSYNDKPIK